MRHHIPALSASTGSGLHITRRRRGARRRLLSAAYQNAHAAGERMPALARTQNDVAKDEVKRDDDDAPGSIARRSIADGEDALPLLDEDEEDRHHGSSHAVEVGYIGHLSARQLYSRHAPADVRHACRRSAAPPPRPAHPALVRGRAVCRGRESPSRPSLALCSGIPSPSLLEHWHAPLLLSPRRYATRAGSAHQPRQEIMAGGRTRTSAARPQQRARPGWRLARRRRGSAASRPAPWLPRPCRR